jgi:hypothetical protein
MAEFGKIAGTEGAHAALDYMFKFNPELATKVASQIASTQESMAKTLESTAKQQGFLLDNDKKRMDAVTQGMGMVAGFGSMLNQVPPEMQAGAFNAMLPHLKKLDANFPTSLADAKTYFAGAAALSIPYDKQYAAQQELNKVQDAAIKAVLFQQQNPNMTPDQKAAVNSVMNQHITAHKEAMDKLWDAKLQQTSNAENDIRKEWNERTKTFQVMYDHYQKVLNGAARQDGAGDTALIYAAFSMLNPDGRPARNLRDLDEHMSSIPEKMRTQIRSVILGESPTLSPQDRQGLLEIATNMYKTRSGFYDADREALQQKVTSYGLNPMNAIPDYRESYYNKMTTNLVKDAATALQQGAKPEAVLQQIESKIGMIEGANSEPVKKFQIGAKSEIEAAKSAVQQGADPNLVLARLLKNVATMAPAAPKSPVGISPLSVGQDNSAIPPIVPTKSPQPDLMRMGSPPPVSGGPSVAPTSSNSGSGFGMFSGSDLGGQ